VKKPVRLLIAAGLVILALVIFWKRRQAAKVEDVPALRTAKVERKDLRRTVSGSGVLEPLTTVEVKANVAGEITQLLVDTGDEVRTGQLIAVIDPTDTESAFREASADMQSSRAKVDEARVNQTFRSTTVPLQIGVAQQELAAALAREDQAKKNLDIQRKTSQADIHQAEEALASAKARLVSTQRSAEAQPSLTTSSIQQAEANLQSAQEDLRELKEATHPRARTQAEASYSQTKSSLVKARLDLKRQKELYAKGFVPQSSVDNAQVSVDTAQSSADSAKAMLDAITASHNAQARSSESRVSQLKSALQSAKTNAVQNDLADQEVISARASVRQAEASLASATANAEQVRIREAEVVSARASVEQTRKNIQLAQANRFETQVRGHQVREAQAQTVRSQAQLDRAAKNLADTSIYAPRDGVIIEKFVEQGTVITSGKSSVTSGTTLVTMADITRMFVLADVDEVDIGGVKPGQKVDLTVESFPEENFSGSVTKVYPKGVDEQNVTVFQVKIWLDNVDTRLRPGMTAESVIVMEEKPEVVVVPNSAIQVQRGQQTVMVVKNGQPERRRVETGLATLDETEILSGLREGEEIVTERPEGQRPGGKGPGGTSGRGPNQDVTRMMRTMGR